MRAIPSLAAAVATALLVSPAFAQSGGGWELRPAPPSWGLPPSAPPSTQPPAAPAARGPAYVGSASGRAAAPAVDLSADAPDGRARAQVARVGGDLDEAMTCAAALQISTLAAPQWSRETGVAQAVNGWLARAFALAEARGVAGDRVGDLVRAEMDRQTEAAAADPQALSRRAFDCATRPPA